MLMFYDVRAQKYLESSINSNRTVVLKASKGYVVCLVFLFNINLNLNRLFLSGHDTHLYGGVSFQMKNISTDSKM